MSDSRMNLEMIEWEDSFGCSTTWQEIADIEPEPLVCKSVGWVVHEDSRCLVIVPHMSQKDHTHAVRQGCGDMTIPVSAIVARKPLLANNSAILGAPRTEKPKAAE